MFSTASFKNTSRAAIAALVIGAASISAVPAQADSANFGFSFNSGNGLSFSIVDGQNQRRGHAAPRQHKRACLSDQQIRSDLHSSGFSNIRIGRENRGDVRVSAVRGRWEYSLKVDRCDGQVATLDRKQIKNQRRHR